MIAVSIALRHSSSSFIEERPPLLAPMRKITLNSSIRAFLSDPFDGSKYQHFRRHHLMCATPTKGSTKGVDQNLDYQRILITAGEMEKPQSAIGEHSPGILKCVNDHEAKGRSNQVGPMSAESQMVENEGKSGGKTDEIISGDTALKGTIAAGLLLVSVVGGFGALSYFYREQINDFLAELSDFLEGYGTAGYALFVAVYAGLEILAIPALPLTMSAGLLFGTVTGTIIVSISGTIAATAAFLIARYLARDRVLKLAEENKKFLAIDKAIGENGFRVVVLLRLSPLLPFSLSNYLYGLTSVKLLPYVLGSWIGMLPGTWAYVSAGAVGRAIIQEEAGNGGDGASEQLWMLGLGLVLTIIAASYVTHLAKDAVKGIDE